MAAKAEFIVKQAAMGPTLVFGKETLAEAIVAAGLVPVVVTEDVDPSLLRNLDKVLETGTYRVLMAHSQFAMRGYDYRSPNCPMTLVVDQPFENLREAI